MIRYKIPVRNSAKINVNSEATVSDILDAFCTSTQGGILFRGVDDWQGLEPGNSGDVLSSGGAGANPSWMAGSGSETGVPIQVFEQVTPVQVSATSGTTPLSTDTNARGSRTIPAGALNSLGAVLEIEIAGDLSTASSPQAAALNLYFGSTVIACTVNGTQASSKTSLGWYGRIRIVTASTGSSGTINTFGSVSAAAVSFNNSSYNCIYECQCTKHPSVRHSSYDRFDCRTDCRSENQLHRRGGRQRLQPLLPRNQTDQVVCR